MMRFNVAAGSTESLVEEGKPAKVFYSSYKVPDKQPRLIRKAKGVDCYPNPHIHTWPLSNIGLFAYNKIREAKYEPPE